MRDNKFTAGPWRLISSKVHIVADGDFGSSVVICRTGYFGQQGDEPPGNRERWEADAHLIAAAPEMYEELMFLTSHFTCECGHKSCSIEAQRRDIEAVLAKARGES